MKEPFLQLLQTSSLLSLSELFQLKSSFYCSHARQDALLQQQEGGLRMNIEQLRHLTAVFRTGSYADASRELYVTPQAISKSIKTLERELGVNLIEKKGNTQALTPFGKSICEDANSILQLVVRITSKADLYSQVPQLPGAINIGISKHGVRGTVFRDAELLQLRQSFRNTTEFVPYYSSSEGCVFALGQGLIDVALIFGAYTFGQIASIPLGYSDICIAVTSSNPLYELSEATIEDISEQPILCPLDINYFYPKLLNRYSLTGFKPPCFLHHQANSPKDEEEFLLSGGAIFVDESSPFPVILPNCRLVPLADESLKLVRSLVYRIDNEPPWLRTLENWFMSHYRKDAA